MTTIQIDHNWTIFLDRDGVINHEKENDYINSWEEFKFYEGAKAALAVFATKFKYIIIITNQRGVGRGITSIENLEEVHRNMSQAVSQAGGRIDGIYFCPDLDKNSTNRKPNAGMAFQAKNDFPDIDFSKTIMVGNNISDMAFGRAIGATTVFLTTTSPHITINHEQVDFIHDSLLQFAQSL